MSIDEFPFCYIETFLLLIIFKAFQTSLKSFPPPVEPLTFSIDMNLLCHHTNVTISKSGFSKHCIRNRVFENYFRFLLAYLYINARIMRDVDARTIYEKKLNTFGRILKLVLTSHRTFILQHFKQTCFL